jgi:hypothetical protein
VTQTQQRVKNFEAQKINKTEKWQPLEGRLAIMMEVMELMDAHGTKNT